MTSTISIIGFGEAAQTFTGDTGWSDDTAGYDINLSHGMLGNRAPDGNVRSNVRLFASNAEAINGASMILSLVTADQSMAAAKKTAETLVAGTLYLDMNSVAPDKKRACQALIQQVGGRYVDVAIMAPVQPARLSVPLLLSGEHAGDAAKHLTSAGFTNVRVVGAHIGDASAIKMVRSVMIKGMEALTAECLLAAHTAGITDEVLTSLGGDWTERANYNLDRMLSHGERRAAEMEEVCATLESLGIDPALSRGTVSRQSELGKIGSIAAPGSLDAKLAFIRNAKRTDTA